MLLTRISKHYKIKISYAYKLSRLFRSRYNARGSCRFRYERMRKVLQMRLRRALGIRDNTRTANTRNITKRAIHCHPSLIIILYVVLTSARAASELEMTCYLRKDRWTITACVLLSDEQTKRHSRLSCKTE